MTYQTVDTATLIRKIESHTAIKLIEQIFPSHPFIGGIEVAFVIKLFSASAKDANESRFGRITYRSC